MGNTIEVNAAFIKKDITLVAPNGGRLLLTPPINKEYWLARVPVSDTQSVVAFPKFGTIGIGFQVEEDWNTNLPYTLSAEKIYEHIRDNKGDDAITDDACLIAISLLQSFFADQEARDDA